MNFCLCIPLDIARKNTGDVRYVLIKTKKTKYRVMNDQNSLFQLSASPKNMRPEFVFTLETSFSVDCNNIKSWFFVETV